MKQVELDVIRSKLPENIYEILYELAGSGFIEKRDDEINRYIFFIEDDHLDAVLDKFSHIEWVSDIKVDSAVEEKGWLKNWYDNYKPIIVKPFKIVPLWLSNDEPVENYIPIYINSGIAFGTGEHETTQLCLKLMSLINIKDKVVLDIGTGSGILAIAASKLGAKKVYAFDLDPVAVEVAKENVKNNNVSNVEVFQGDALSYRGKYYDVITANLVWGILKKLSRSIKRMIKRNGFLIASGILEDQLLDFINLYESEGFKYINHVYKNDWVGVLLSG